MQPLGLGYPTNPLTAAVDITHLEGIYDIMFLCIYIL